MGHYLSETPGYERPVYNSSHLHTLNYASVPFGRHLWFHKPCMRVFYVGDTTGALPKGVRKHAKKCKL